MLKPTDANPPRNAYIGRMERSSDKPTPPLRGNKLREDTATAPLKPEDGTDARNQRIDALFDATRARFPKTIAALAKR